MKIIKGNDVWKYFENYQDSDKLEGIDTASRRYYLEQIHFNDKSVFAITTSSCTPTRVIDTIKVVEYDTLEQAKRAWREFKAKTKYLARIEFNGVAI
jgi:hypothetical protein